MAEKSYLNQSRHGGEAAEVHAEPVSPPSAWAGTQGLPEARLIPIERIRPDPAQPRTRFDEERLAELRSSIKRNGILQPLTVQYVGDGDYFRIISGERRFRAARMAGLRALPCIVRSPDRTEKLAQQLIENLQREDLSPIDKARGLMQLKVALGPTTRWKAVEDVTGISERRRQHYLALLELPEIMQRELVSIGAGVARNQVTEKHARALLLLNQQPEAQQQLFERIKSGRDRISGEQALKIARNLRSKTGIKHKKISFTYTTTTDLIKQLEAKLDELKAGRETPNPGSGSPVIYPVQSN